jgi:hypothetical protein
MAWPKDVKLEMLAGRMYAWGICISSRSETADQLIGPCATGEALIFSFSPTCASSRAVKSQEECPSEEDDGLD